jgi:outer membrane protein OmpA-like peptidoglycan-associated protein
MAKRADDSGEIMVPGKPGSASPPPAPGRTASKKSRPFPVRLWAWAILMTAAAGAGGYFAWIYRGDKIHAEDALGTVTTERDGFKAAAEIDHKQLGECQVSVSALNGKAKDTETQLTQTTSAAADCKTALETAQIAKQESDKRMAALANFQKKFSDMVGTGKIKVSGHRGNLVLELPSEVLFSSGQAELSETGQLNVLQVGLILKEFPDRRFLVVGHTDAAPLAGSIYKDNWELSTARARSSLGQRDVDRPRAQSPHRDHLAARDHRAASAARRPGRRRQAGEVADQAVRAWPRSNARRRSRVIG